MSAAIAMYKNFTLAVHVMVAAHGLIVRRMAFTDLTLKRVDRKRASCNRLCKDAKCGPGGLGVLLRKNSSEGNGASLNANRSPSDLAGMVEKDNPE